MLFRYLQRFLSPGSSVRFRVRAFDTAGNVSAWAEAAPSVVEPAQATSTSIDYTGWWSRRYGSTAYGSYTRYASTARATAVFTFTGKAVAWVAPEGTGRGRARISVNGTYVRTIDLDAATTESRRIVFTRSWTRSAKRTVSVEVVGTSGRPRVDVDAFVVLR